jgi:hypothetical protein
LVFDVADLCERVSRDDGDDGRPLCGQPAMAQGVSHGPGHEGWPRRRAGLRRREGNFEANAVSVSRKLGEVNDSLSFSAPKSAAGRLTVGIPSFVARSLAMHLDLYALHGKDGLVFPGADGGLMRRSNYRRPVREPATAVEGMTGFR